MKVKDLIKQLSYYDGEKELLVAYWDKEYAETAFDSEGGFILTDTAWADAIKRTENMDFWQECANNELMDQVLLAINAEKEGENK
jgi:hypothetical protein